MALKTFNIDAEIYDEFSKHCKKHGISMSKKVERFIASEIKVLKSGNRGIIDRVGMEKAEREKELMDDHPLSKYC